jgi:HK97 gp10 family phage protein
MAKFTMSVDGTSSLRSRFDAADGKIRTQVIKDLNRYGVILASKLREGAPKDEGNLRKQIRSFPATANDPFVTIRAGAIYTTWQDEGTKAHFPPPEALIGWSKRHPFKDDDGKKISPESEAFLIARAIAKRGLKAKHFIPPAVEPAKSEVVRILKSSLSAVKI